MGSSERRERERQEMRAKILEAARELFAAEGVDATTMRAIAERIEYSPTVIYSYFSDKRALLHELSLSDLQSLAQRFSALERLSDPIKRLRRLGQAYADFGIQHPQSYRFMFMTPKPPLDTGGDPRTDPCAYMSQVVRACMDEGAFKPHLKDPNLIAQTIWGALHGAISLHIGRGERPDATLLPIEKRVSIMLDIMIEWVAR